MSIGRFAAIILWALAANFLFSSHAQAEQGYAGSKSCAECHVVETEQWKNSHHAWAWNEPSNETVLGNFDDSSFTSNSKITRFFIRGEDYFVETDGPDGITTKFRIRYTAGVTPLQQYIVETAPGRLQALDIAWDTITQRWFDLYPLEETKAGDGFHWTGPYKNWNGRCAECHATGYKKNYAIQSKTFSSTQAEIGVGCEACHGPGQLHIDSLNSETATNKYSPKENWFLDFSSASVEIQQCAGCHSRRETLVNGTPLPGTPFQDAYDLALLRPDLYHSDGSIKNEVYVYGSFLQSKMFASGVQCTDCHNAHTAALKAEGTALCAQCHSPVGNSRFPELKKKDYDNKSHHFHEPESEAAECTSCHMLERNFMQVDARSDHSFRIPRPDLSTETGAPNSCTDCHADQTPEWAASEITKRYPNAGTTKHFSQTFSEALLNSSSSIDGLFQIANDSDEAGIVRASALDLIRSSTSSQIAKRSVTLLGDSDPLIRSAAMKLQRGASAEERVERLGPLLSDTTRSVRVTAARELMTALRSGAQAKVFRAFQTANREQMAAFAATSDFPETNLKIGGVALMLRNFPSARVAFQEAVRLDPQLVDGWIILIRLANARGDRKEALAIASRALEANPNDPTLKTYISESKKSNP